MKRTTRYAVLVTILAAMTVGIGGCESLLGMDDQSAELQSDAVDQQSVISALQQRLTELQAKLSENMTEEDRDRLAEDVERISAKLAEADEKFGAIIDALNAMGQGKGDLGDVAGAVAPAVPYPWNLALYGLSLLIGGGGAGVIGKKKLEQLRAERDEQVAETQQMIETIIRNIERAKRSTADGNDMVLDKKMLKAMNAAAGIEAEIESIRA